MFSPFFFDDPFGYQQPRAPRRRGNVPFFMDDDYEETQSYYNHPQRQRQVPVHPQRYQQQTPQQVYHQHPQKQQPTNRRNVPQPQRPQKHQVKARPKVPDLQTCHRAATQIEKVFRGYQIRKLQIIPKLKQLTKVEQEFKLIKLKLEHVTEVLQQLWPKNVEELDLINYRITHKKLLECEEEMTKKLIFLDSISSGQSQFIRTTRKQIVETISAALQTLEPIKKNSVQKLQQLQEYHTYLEEQKLAEQARQMEAQNANPTVELETTAELPGNPFSSDEETSEDSEELPTVSDPMEEADEESEPQEDAQEMVVQNSTPVPQSNDNLAFDQTTLASMCYQTIQQLLERQNKMLQEKENTIRSLQSRIEQLEQRTPAVAAQ